MQLFDGEEEAEGWIDATQCDTSCHGNPWFDLVWHQWRERSLEVRAPCMGLRFLHQDITGSGSSVPGPMATTPCSLFLSACACFFFFERPTLRVGHSALGCNNRKANATITRVYLYENKIGDRGAVALAGAIQALLATVFSCRPHSLILRFGLDNVLPVTLSRSYDVLENRALGTLKKCKLCSVRAERARNLLSSTLKHAGVLCTAGGQCFRLLLCQVKQHVRCQRTRDIVA